MRGFERRVKRIEKELRLGRGEPQVSRMIVVKTYDDEPPQERPPGFSADLSDGDTADWQTAWKRQRRKALGPVKEWITYQEQYEAGLRAYEERIAKDPPVDIHFDTITISLSPGAEEEARQRQETTKPNKHPKIEGEE